MKDGRNPEGPQLERPGVINWGQLAMFVLVPIGAAIGTLFGVILFGLWNAFG
jgi:hypothetical protein